MATVRSYPVNLLPDPKLFPRDLFDPRWKDPAVQARVAFEAYRRLRTSGVSFDGEALISALPPRTETSLDRRTFEVTPRAAPKDRDARFVGGAVNELHRRIAFAGGRPTVNIHAQVVTFGADSEGRWFLRANLGRVGGEDGNEAALGISFSSNDRGVGAFEVTRSVDPGDDQAVFVVGTSSELAKGFDSLTRIEVRLFAQHHGKRAPKGHGRSSEAISLFGE
ncbi:MAG: hypothetical protein HY791_23825 [Deltaproteobacteria bacterium]|nr:hypothetical protein [Deltaproteobacteria bacterium]